MATLDTALDNWAAWTVTGLTLYGLGSAPVQIYPAHLPMVRIDMFFGRGEGQKQRGFTAPQADNVFYFKVMGLTGIPHLGLPGAGVAEAAAKLETYLQKCAADPRLTNTLRVGMESLDPYAGVIRFNEVAYWGFTLLHRWEIFYS